MSSSEIGFLVGALPGLTLVVRNMLALRRRVNEAEEIARAEGNFLDFQYSASSMQSDFLFSPGSFIKANDQAGIRRAKEHLLLVRRLTIKRHVVGGIVVMIGAILGTFLATGFWPDR
ncbi:MULTISPECIES: hypothetical protein [unclassified Luteibacter]|uniref:hypothetical protein n=1 Tax=Luteibacter sp. PvP019 TaxID=3156436 RepID=UPI003396C8C8